MTTSHSLAQTHDAQELYERLWDCGAVKTGQFTLKSGATSNVFINCGTLRGSDLAALGPMIIKLIQQTFPSNSTRPIVLLGLPYKGIPLAAVAAATATDYGFAYLRKEEKPHGEGGWIVGSVPPGARIIAVDDVLTRGTAIRETVTRLEQHGLKLSGALVLIDREETGEDARVTYRSKLESDLQIKISAIGTKSGAIAATHQG